MITSLTRRSALAGIIATVTATATPSRAETGVALLWDRYSTYLEASRLLGAEWDAAYASIPAWAQSGPSRIDSAGNYCGQQVGWPLDESIAPPEHRNAYRIVRVSPTDIRERFENDATMFPKQRAAIRARARRAMRRLLPLLRAQKAERERVGLAAIDARIGANTDAMLDIEDAIRASPISHERAAALMLIDVTANSLATSTIETDAAMGVAALALEALAPSITGRLGSDVRFYLAHRDLPLSQMPFVGG